METEQQNIEQEARDAFNVFLDSIKTEDFYKTAPIDFFIGGYKAAKLINPHLGDKEIK